MLQRKRPYHQRHPALTQSNERRDLRRFKLKALTEEVRPFPDQYAYQVVCTELHSPELGRYVASVSYTHLDVYKRQVYNPGNKIIRPAYKAVAPLQKFIPLDERG